MYLPVILRIFSLVFYGYAAVEMFLLLGLRPLVKLGAVCFSLSELLQQAFLKHVTLTRRGF